MTDEELKKYLPRFLPEDEQNSLFSDLKQLTNMGNIKDPNGADIIRAMKGFYASYGNVAGPVAMDQGDGMDGLPIFKLPEPECRIGRGIILSNACDINPYNKRKIPMNVIYAPILNLEKYEEKLRKKNIYSDDWGRQVRLQQITQLLYLPKGSGLEHEGIVPLDQMNSIPAHTVPPESIRPNRVFQLSLFGWYLLHIKLTHHFVRTSDDLIKNRSPRLNP